MSLFNCFNPVCCGGFNTRCGMDNHIMCQKNYCVNYAVATIMCASSDGSDSDTDSNSIEVVDENIIDNNDNFTIGKDVIFFLDCALPLV